MKPLLASPWLSFSVDTGEKRRLTSPLPPVLADRGPALSADGRVLAFSRATAIQATDVYVLRLSADLRPEGEPKPLTQDRRWNDSPAWLADGREILFSSNRDGSQSMWRVPVSGDAPPTRLPLGGGDLTFPAISRQARRLIYAQTFQDSNVWRVNLPDDAGKTVAPAMFISSSRLDANADYSPDGRHIAFQSDPREPSRSGSPTAMAAFRQLRAFDMGTERPAGRPTASRCLRLNVRDNTESIWSGPTGHAVFD